MVPLMLSRLMKVSLMLALPPPPLSPVGRLMLVWGPMSVVLLKTLGPRMFLGPLMFLNPLVLLIFLMPVILLVSLGSELLLRRPVS